MTTRTLKTLLLVAALSLTAAPASAFVDFTYVYVDPDDPSAWVRWDTQVPVQDEEPHSDIGIYFTTRRGIAMRYHVGLDNPVTCKTNAVIVTDGTDEDRIDVVGINCSGVGMLMVTLIGDGDTLDSDALPRSLNLEDWHTAFVPLIGDILRVRSILDWRWPEECQ